jgi:hypothetical protein
MRRFSVSLLLVALAAACPATAAAATGGGVSADDLAAAPSAPSSGGTQFGAKIARAKVVRPVAHLSVSTPLRAGRDSPRIRVSFSEHGVLRVNARVVVVSLPHNTPVARIVLGHVRVGRTISVRWPKKLKLPAGSYLVRVHARDPFNHVLERLAHASGRSSLVVTAAPKPPTAPLAPATPAPGSVLPGGTFPVAGAHSYGDLFGASRKGYSHQGVDVLAAEGTQVVAPVAGTITITDYQASAAGYYVVEQATDGRSFFFAHCQKGSFGAKAGEVVTQGAAVCRVGHTGDATGPHLHFEEWLGGWRVDSHSVPVDPLPQLRAWDHAHPAR